MSNPGTSNDSGTRPRGVRYALIALVGSWIALVVWALWNEERLMVGFVEGPADASRTIASAGDGDGDGSAAARGAGESVVTTGVAAAEDATRVAGAEEAESVTAAVAEVAEAAAEAEDAARGTAAAEAEDVAAAEAEAAAAEDAARSAAAAEAERVAAAETEAAAAAAAAEAAREAAREAAIAEAATRIAAAEDATRIAAAEEAARVSAASEAVRAEAAFQAGRRAELRRLVELVEGITFVPREDAFLRTAPERLESAFEIMFLYPRTRVELVVESRETFDAASNRLLGLERAARIREYLVSRGIERERVTIGTGDGVGLPFGEHRVRVRIEDANR